MLTPEDRYNENNRRQMIAHFHDSTGRLLQGTQKGPRREINDN